MNTTDFARSLFMLTNDVPITDKREIGGGEIIT